MGMLLHVLLCTVASCLVYSYGLGEEIDISSDGLTKDFALQDLTDAAVEGEACQCDTSSCQCCKTLNIKLGFLHIKKQVCAKLVYDKANIGVDLQVTVDGKVIMHQNIKVKNPQPICGSFNLPKLGDIKVCIKLDNMKLDNTGVSGCLKLTTQGKVQINLDIGCFKIPHSSARWIKSRYIVEQEIEYIN